jgi:quercetin dioxygenase-like cupin family protein
MTRRTIAASGVAAALAGTLGVALALQAHGSPARAVAATSKLTAAAIPTPAPLVHATVGAFHFSSDDFKIDSHKPSEVVMPQITIHPGASSGWHTHPGPGFIVVTAGTVTLYQDIDNTCLKSTYGPGQGWVESPGVVHIAVNAGTVDVTAVATFLDVAPGTTAYKSIVPAPATCAGIK